MRLRILGPLQVWDGAKWQRLSAPKWRSLVAALLVRPGQGVSVQQLIDDVWGDDAPRGAVNQVHGYVGRVRRALGDPEGRLLVSRAPGYSLRLSDEDVDARHFEVLTAQGMTARRRGEPEVAAKLLTEALDLWRGPALADIPPTLLTQTETDRLEELRLSALESRVASDLELERHAGLIPELQAETAKHPLREQLWAHLMLALYRSGRQAEALGAYQRLHRHLVDEIGVEPDRRVQDLHQRILHSDISLDPTVKKRVRPSRSAAIPRQIPAAVRHFAGRERQLDALDDLAAWSWQSETTPIALVTGTAGIGKTTTVVQWAHRVAGQFPDGQLYVNLRGFGPTGSPSDPAEAIRGFLDALAVPPDRMPPNLDALAALYRSVLAGRRMLLVLDNAHDADQVRPLLPGSPGCIVVVTSRNQLGGLVAAEGAQPVTLDLLTDKEALDLLGSQLGTDRIDCEREAAFALIEHCARLPLAVTIAAARAAIDPELPIAELAGQLADARSRLDRLDAGEQATNVRAVLSWSYRGRSDDARRLFRLLGIHPGPDITTAAAASLVGSDVATADRLLRELNRAHLIAEQAPGRLSFHDLLRAYAVELAATDHSDSERRLAQHRCFDHYLHTAHAADRLLRRHHAPIDVAAPLANVTPEVVEDQTGALDWFVTERAVLVAAATSAADSGFDVHAWQLATTLGEFLGRRGHTHDLVAVQSTALTAARRVDDSIGQAHAHRGLARAQAFLGSYDEAEGHYLDALREYAEVGDVIAQAGTHLGLAGLAERQRRYDDSLQHSRDALTFYQSMGDGAGQARALNMVGWYEARLGNYRAALDFCTQALDLHRAAGDRGTESDTLDSLGYVHHHLGDYERAVACYQDAIDRQREFGDHRGEADTLAHLGDSQLAAGNADAARTSWQRALTILDELDHPDADEVRAKLDELATAGPDSPAPMTS
jgi:DNA-binding SARP family transcriptional activator